VRVLAVVVPTYKDSLPPAHRDPLAGGEPARVDRPRLVEDREHVVDGVGRQPVEGAGVGQLAVPAAGLGEPDVLRAAVLVRAARDEAAVRGDGPGDALRAGRARSAAPAHAVLDGAAAPG